MADETGSVGSMELDLILCPYSRGRFNFGMGAGVTLFGDDEGLHADLVDAGWRVTVERVPSVDESQPEITCAVELDRRLAHRVKRARLRGAFPLVFAGDCNSCLGTVAGVGPDGLGVVWFDAHGDFDTPENNTSGYFEDFPLSILTGTGWAALRETIPGFAPIPERHVVLAAVRDCEPYQWARLDSADIRTVRGALDEAELRDQLDALAEEVDRVYLHVDLDALDISVGRANGYAAAGGPTIERMLAVVADVFERFTVVAAAFTAYDPAFDLAGGIGDAGRQLSASIAEKAAGQARR